MADGDIILDESFPVEKDGSRYVVVFTVVDSGYPGGYYYRFQYYDTDSEEAILRYDNANDAHGVGPHHRHLFDEVTGLTFRGLESHVLRFTIEVLEIHARI